MENSLAVSLKVKHKLTIQTSKSIPKTYMREMKVYIHIHMYMNVHRSIMYNSPNLNKLKCLVNEEIYSSGISTW